VAKLNPSATTAYEAKMSRLVDRMYFHGVSIKLEHTSHPRGSTATRTARGFSAAS
jgi:hypothetical protein